MTPKQFAFQNNLKIAIMILSIIILIFLAGAFFSGYKPTFGTYIIITQAVLSLIYSMLNKPTPPQNP